MLVKRYRVGIMLGTPLNGEWLSLFMSCVHSSLDNIVETRYPSPHDDSDQGSRASIWALLFTNSFGAVG